MEVDPDAFQGLAEAMERATPALVKVAYAFISLSDAFYWKAGFPVTPKLCIDGREYHRRQKRRTKRKRRR